MLTQETTRELETLLPAGYSARPAALSDLEELVAVFNASAEKLIGSSTKYTVAQQKTALTTPGFDVATDSWLVIAPDGKIAGYSQVQDFAPHVSLYCWGRVHPDHEGKGIGTYLLRWSEIRAREAVAKVPEDARVVMRYFVISLNESANKLFADNGMRTVRYTLRMVIDLNTQPPSPQFPEGITVRTMVRPDDDRAVVHTSIDSFRDHWGFVESPFEEELEDWQHYMDTDDDFDETLNFLAMDGDQIVGVSMCSPHTIDAADMGWVNTLGVLRDWRRQGLALALLYHSFNEFYKRGKPRVGLSVDAGSLTGATRLYERAGMHPDPTRQYTTYEKELRAGKDISMQSL
jgi:mycothiol synthase